MKRRIAASVLFYFLGALPSPAEPQKKRPELIRDTDRAEGKEDAEIAKPKDFNPMLAEKSVKVGDFYLKRRNYDAAIQRYQEALEYQPNLAMAYEKLGRAYERRAEDAPSAAAKSEDLERAKELYQEFLRKQPQSPKAAEFRSRLKRLENSRN
jgi:tetratricopeptide (TPR) repeat protein